MVCSLRSICERLVEVVHVTTSSAKRPRLAPGQSVMDLATSLKKMMNRTGPRTLPWGIPALIGWICDSAPEDRTENVRPLRYDDIQRPR